MNPPTTKTTKLNKTDNISKSPTDLLGQSRKELEALCQDLSVSQVHATNIFRRIHKHQLDFNTLGVGLPKVVMNALASSYSYEEPMTIISHLRSQYDLSIKFLMSLHDGAQIETVLMPESKRITLCVSSQVGCAQGCTFCHTGRMGLKRNLTAAEVVGQVWMANRWLRDNPQWLLENRLPLHLRITNVVFMGMGEPLDNVDAVSQSLTILSDDYGPHIAMRRISVSTAGHIDGIKKIIALHPTVKLALSVHSPFNNERSKIMPINRRWPLDTLFEFLKNEAPLQADGILLQYTLISGVNDSLDHAKELIRLTAGMNVKINLIPLNPVGPSRFKSPDQVSVETFRDYIYNYIHSSDNGNQPQKGSMRVLVRYSKGQDIAAACGQLVTTAPANLQLY
jgi:23S rRNA (adenine2503-C2)-methyltransferase